MRIGIGLVLLSDLIIRATALTAHYTQDGILPVSLLLEFDSKPLRWSFHYLNDSFAYQAILFILNGIVALFLIVGYRTRLITFLAWVFLVSLQNRNPFIQQSGDDLLRLILFWALFMPWGNFYSWDSKKLNSTVKNYFSFASFGYLLLIVSVYLFSAIQKTSPEWRTEGTAIYYTLSLDQLKVGMGDWLYERPTLMKFLTFLIFYYFDILVPLLLLIPFKNQMLRALCVLSLILLHIGISLNVYVGLFFVIGITSSLGLLPSSVMDWFDEKIFKIKTNFSDTFYETKLNYILRSCVNSFLAFIIFFCLLYNLGCIPSFKYVLADKMVYLTNSLRLDQYWGMFSPNVYKTDGWYIYRGIKQNDSIWDIYNNKPGLDHAKPLDIDKMYPTDRWRKFAENFQKNDYNFMRPYYCKYLIREWNKKHPDNKIAGLNIIFLLEESLPDYKTAPLKEQNTCLCYENEP
ncbi:MAG TPA: hypothetical protein VN026_00910, partial [Bacteroidia bacterium]|nr:hypothetical protein [Bacteroidia bacterium]